MYLFSLCLFCSRYCFSHFLFPSSSHHSSHLFSVMPRFTEQVESAVEALSANPTLPVDENEFIDASRLVYDGIRDIRKAVLMIRVSRAVLFFYSCNIRLDFSPYPELKTNIFYLKWQYSLFSVLYYIWTGQLTFSTFFSLEHGQSWNGQE